MTEHSRSTLRQAVRLALYAGIATSFGVQPALAQDDEAKQLEKVEVTGSHIKRVDVEGPQPILSLDREDIEKMGVNTVAEVLRNLPQNSGGSFDEKFTNSFAPGSAGVSLRGLGQNTTLILLNGRRIANYGFAQNITDSFVNLNSIPLGAVDRIEILKDGASAIYGSDAIAGVINIILRKDYQGAEVSTSAGGTTHGDGQEYTTNLSYGLTDNKSSLFVSADFFNRNDIMLRDREYSKTADHRSQGGIDFRSSSGNPGTIFTFDGDIQASPDCPPDRYDDFGTDGAISICRFNYNEWITGVPAVKRGGIFTTYNREITDDIEMFTEFSVVENVTDAKAAPTPVFGDLDGFVSPASNPWNAQYGYDEDVTFRRRLTEAGPRTSHIEEDNQRLLAGLRGAWSRWDWEVGAMFSRDKVVDTGDGYISADALDQALTEGIDVNGDGIITDNEYLNVFGTTNDPDLIDAITVTTARRAVSTLRSFDGKISGDVLDLPAGAVGMAVGLERRYEKVEDRADPLSEQSKIVSSGGTSSDGSRSLTSAYVEFSVPVIESLEAQVALRHENYSDFGTTTKPKVAFRFQPVDMLMIRGSYAEGFRAPSLAQLYLGDSTSFPFLVDPARCDVTGADADCGGSQYRTIFGGNPDLDPEESKSYYLGFVVEPVENLSMGVDLWRIDYTNEIDDVDPQFILNNEDLFPGAVTRGPDELFNGELIPGPIISIDSSYQNLAERKVSGVDLDVSYKWQTGFGEFSAQGILTHLTKYEWIPRPGEDPVDLDGEYTYPKNRAVASLFWNREDWEAGLTANYIGSYNSFFEIKPVNSWTTWDVQATYSGFGDSRITLGVENLTDQDPPFSDSEIEGYDFSTANPRGRFVYARFSTPF